MLKTNFQATHLFSELVLFYMCPSARVQVLGPELAHFGKVWLLFFGAPRFQQFLFFFGCPCSILGIVYLRFLI